MSGARLRRLLLAGACVWGVAVAPASAADDGAPGAGRLWVPGQVIVRLASGVDDAQRDRILTAAGATPAWRMTLPGMEVVTAARGAGVAATVRALKRQPGVRWAEPNYVMDPPADPAPRPPSSAPAPRSASTSAAGPVARTSAAAAMNDPFYAGSWLRRTFWGDRRKAQGQWGVRRIGADRAWAALRRGDRWLDSRVAVVDTGVDLSHEDLAGRLLVIPEGTKYPGGGPVVQDAMALRPRVPHNHGTEVTGVIAANGDNGIGMTGVNPRAHVLDIGGLDMAVYAEAMLFAAAQGIKIINLSSASSRPAVNGRPPTTKVEHPTFDAALHALADQGVLVVASAGNEQADVNGRIKGRGKTKDKFEATPHYSLPCRDSVDYPNLLCVAATDGTEGLSWFSNWGADVQLGAPGSDIITSVVQDQRFYWTFPNAMLDRYGARLLDPKETLFKRPKPNGKPDESEYYDRSGVYVREDQKESPYRLNDGTSFAAPIVTGAFSLLEACVGPALRQEALDTDTPYYEVLMQAMRDHGIRKAFPGPKKGETREPLKGKVAWGGRLDVGQLFDHYGPKCQSRAASSP